MQAKWLRQPIVMGSKGRPRKILVTGATGFIGTSLCRKLIENGDQVTVLSRDEKKARAIFGPHIKTVTDLETLNPGTKLDAVISLAGAPVAGGLWTKKRKQLLIDSRVQGLQAIEKLVKRMAQIPRVLVNASATGFYGMRGDEALTEEDDGQESFQSILCQQREAAANVMEKYGVRVCNLRMGVVFDRDGGAFPAMLRPILLGMGAIVGSGRQWISWIYKPDLIRLILFCLSQEHLAGPINATTPCPITNREFVSAVAKHYGKPVLFVIPAFLLRLALGELSQLLLRGHRVLPAKALKASFGFNQATLEKMLYAMDKRDDAEEINVYYNHDCPVCKTEIMHYKGIAENNNCRIRFTDINKQDISLVKYGLTKKDMKRRLYVNDGQGHLKSGVDAFVVIWRRLPNYQWLARLFEISFLHQIGDIFYDRVCVPFLAFVNVIREKLMFHHKGVTQ